MDIESDSSLPSIDSLLLERLHGELEQARVALEDTDARIAELSADNAELQNRLREEVRRREAAERELDRLRAAAETTPSENTTEIALREQLSTALEELHVMAEELTLAHDALSQGSGADRLRHAAS